MSVSPIDLPWTRPSHSHHHLWLVIHIISNPYTCLSHMVSTLPNGFVPPWLEGQYFSKETLITANRYDFSPPSCPVFGPLTLTVTEMGHLFWCFLHCVSWYNYATCTNEMHAFEIGTLINYFFLISDIFYEFRSSWLHPQAGSCKHYFCMVSFSCVYVSSLAGGKGHTNKEFCVLHVQSNTTIFYLVVQ